jgi:hypothetical protein
MNVLIKEPSALGAGLILTLMKIRSVDAGSYLTAEKQQISQLCRVNQDPDDISGSLHGTDRNERIKEIVSQVFYFRFSSISAQFLTIAHSLFLIFL